MNWETYYDGFYDWNTSTQISRLSALTTFGKSSEITEVAQELMDEKAASRLIKKAVAAGVKFTEDDVFELSDICDAETMKLLEASSGVCLDDDYGNYDYHNGEFIDDEPDFEPTSDHKDKSVDEIEDKSLKLNFFETLMLFAIFCGKKGGRS